MSLTMAVAGDSSLFKLPADSQDPIADQVTHLAEDRQDLFVVSRSCGRARESTVGPNYFCNTSGTAARHSTSAVAIS